MALKLFWIVCKKIYLLFFAVLKKSNNFVISTSSYKDFNAYESTNYY